MKVATGMSSLALLILSFGVGWLLDELAVGEPIAWIAVIMLSVTGLLVLAIGGWNKLTVFVGPGLLAAAGMSVLYQLDWLSGRLMGPALLIVVGGLLLLSALLPAPLPQWMRDDEPRQQQQPSERGGP